MIWRIACLTLIVAFSFFFFTNPSHSDHKQVVYASAATEATQSEILGKMAADILGQRELIPLTYNNYYVCSTTTLDGKIQSVGAFSHVWNWK